MGKHILIFDDDIAVLEVLQMVLDYEGLEVNIVEKTGWVVLIPGGKNVFLYRKDERWLTIPQNINALYAEKIGKKLTGLTI